MKEEESAFPRFKANSAFARRCAAFVRSKSFFALRRKALKRGGITHRGTRVRRGLSDHGWHGRKFTWSYSQRTLWAIGRRPIQPELFRTIGLACVGAGRGDDVIDHDSPRRPAGNCRPRRAKAQVSGESCVEKARQSAEGNENRSRLMKTDFNGKYRSLMPAMVRVVIALLFNAPFSPAQGGPSEPRP
jgi:hypothetical protein